MKFPELPKYNPPPPIGVSIDEAKLRLSKQMDHAISMANALQEQFSDIKEIQNIYRKTASEDLKNLKEEKLKEFEKLAGENPLRKKEIKRLKEFLKNAENEAIKKIKDAQTTAIGHMMGKEHKEHHIKILSSGSWAAKLKRIFLVPKKTIKAFKEEIEDRNKAQMEEFKEKLDREKLDNDYTEISEELGGLRESSYLSRVDGVIYTKKLKLILIEPKKVKKQLKSYTAQELSHKERTTITKEINLGKKEDIKATSTLTPLNRSFHEKLRGNLGNYFTKVFRSYGVSSFQRTGRHLINGWMTELSIGGKKVYSAYRHGIISHKSGKSKKEREDFAMQMAKDLMTAIILEKLSKRGLSIEDAVSLEPPLEIFLSSISLVTPDDLREFWENKGESEKEMLADQVEALKELAKIGSFEIQGKEIPIKAQVFAFNYGVNAGAVGKLSFAPGIKLGLETQHSRYNRESAKKLTEYVDDVLRPPTDKSPEGSLYWQTKEKLSGQEGKEFNRLVYDLQQLNNDIKKLNKSKEAYLDGGNQYEVGAKIIVLMNTLERLGDIAKKSGVKNVPDFAAAFNCMSGKDRTGIMDAMAKAMSTMQEVRGSIPTHDELVTREDFRKEFLEYLIKYLKEGGGLEITELNTDAAGYKVKAEAMIYNMLPEIFEAEVQKLSFTTKG